MDSAMFFFNFLYAELDTNKETGGGGGGVGSGGVGGGGVGANRPI